MENEIISYQFAERLKAALIISSKMLLVLEGLREDELEGAKKVMFAFFDALSTETMLAVKATGMQDFKVAAEKITLVKRMIEEGNLREAHATLGSTVTNATTACASTMKALTEKGLL